MEIGTDLSVPNNLFSPEQGANINHPFTAVEMAGEFVAKMQKLEEQELARFSLDSDMGEVLLTNYASCGKKWDEEEARISVWFKQK